jgi:hypothetical protein
VRNSVFVGQSQTDNGYNTSAGPFANGNSESLKCDNTRPEDSNFCTSVDQGVSFQLAAFSGGQRLFSIYDGPAYQESNIYLDIQKSTCKDCMYASVLGVRKNIPDKKTPTTFECYLPNAAIGWKQPNGFFYPPSFHSSNLFFDKVDIRHYVIDTLSTENTYIDSTARLQTDYCPILNGGYPDNYFGNFTDVDRQTELNDDDGSLTGLTNSAKTGTVSLNPVEFFDAPLQTAECLSNIGVTPNLACPLPSGDLPPTQTRAGANTSPYDYVTTIVFPSCAVGSGRVDGRCGSSINQKVDPNNGKHILEEPLRGGSWSQDCTAPFCYGVPLYRQFLTGSGDNADNATREAKRWFASNCKDAPTTKDCRFPMVRMSGQATYQRSSMTANHGTYYLDTSVTLATQQAEPYIKLKDCSDPTVTAAEFCDARSVNVFEGGKTYYLFLLFAKPETKQTYQIYVGPGFDIDSVKAIRPQLTTTPFETLNKAPDSWQKALTKNYNDKTACAGFKDENCGILQVTVDFAGLAEFEPTAANGLCRPQTFCTASGTSCGCAFNEKTSPLPPIAVANAGIINECKSACSQWAVKDLDFPEKIDPETGRVKTELGPLGFSFTMPSNFAPDGMGQAHRPPPNFFPVTAEAGKPDWLTQFVTTATLPDGKAKSTPGGGGDCFYPALPTNATPLTQTTCAMPKTAPVP